MTDPLNPADNDLEAFRDGGLNSSDTQDWADRRTAGNIKLLATVVLPLIFVAIAIFAAFFWWQRSLKPTSVSKPVAVAASPVDKDTEIAQLQSQILSLQSQVAHPNVAGASAAPTPTVYAADPAAVAQLSARMDRLEANQRALGRAAALANAASDLRLADKGPAPFSTQLALVEAGLDNPHLVDGLRPFAEKGVPSEIALAIAFPRIAAQANIASKDDSADDSLLSHAKQTLGSFISIRRTDNVVGLGAGATLQRAETRLSQGDLSGAVGYLSTLPASSQRAIKPWLDQAKARVLVDQTTDRISEAALSRLSQTRLDSGQADGGAL